MSLLSLSDLHVGIASSGLSLISGVDLALEAGSCHVLMGPNGSGKSSLLSAIMGLKEYAVLQGSMSYQGQDMPSGSSERAAAGIFMSFQNPPVIAGVSNMMFYKSILQQKCKHRGLPVMSSGAMLKEIHAAAEEVGLSSAMLQRHINLDFSGGERRRNEMLQMRLLEPKLVLLDEIDAGLDRDATERFARMIADGQKRGQAFLIVTHSFAFLEHLDIDAVHILYAGRYRACGARELLNRIMQEGFASWHSTSSS